MPTLKKAVIKSYDPAAHKATVQIAGSLAVWLDTVPVATDIPAAEVVAGRECAVLFFTDDNPDDAVVVTVHGAVPAPVAGPPKRIQDADNNTYVDTELNPNEDKVRISTAAVERILVQTAAPHLTLTGDTRLEGNVAIKDAPNPDQWLRLFFTGSLAQSVDAINIAVTGLTLTGNSRSFRGLVSTATMNVQAATTGHSLFGLNFVATPGGGGAGTVVDNAAAIFLRVGATAFTGTVTALKGLWIAAPNIFLGNPVITTSWGLHIENAGPSAKIADAYGLQIADITLNTGFRRLIEAGPATPNLRLEANAPDTEQDSRLLVAFLIGGVTVLKRIAIGPADSGGLGFRALRVAN